VIQLIQGADSSGNDLRRHSGIAGRGVDARVAEQHLDDAEVGAVFQQVSGETVA